MFLRAQADMPAKLRGFAYAFEHLEIASHEVLKRVAISVEDTKPIAAADELLLQDRTAAAGIHELFDRALEASLQEAGVEA